MAAIWHLIAKMLKCDFNAIWHEQRLTEDDSFQTECPVLLSLVRILMCLPIGSVENERGFSALNRLLDQLRNRMKPKHTNSVVRLNGQKDKMLADYSPQVLEFLCRVLRPDVHMVGTDEGNDVRFYPVENRTAEGNASMHALMALDTNIRESS